MGWVPSGDGCSQVRQPTACWIRSQPVPRIATLQGQTANDGTGVRRVRKALVSTRRLCPGFCAGWRPTPETRCQPPTRLARRARSPGSPARVVRRGEGGCAPGKEGPETSIAVATVVCVNRQWTRTRQACWVDAQQATPPHPRDRVPARAECCCCRRSGVADAGRLASRPDDLRGIARRRRVNIGHTGRRHGV